MGMLQLVQILLQFSPYSNPYTRYYLGAGSIFTEQLITTLVAILAVLAFSIQISRAYFLRVLRKFTLRLAADVWWLVYVLLRDAGIFLVLFFGVTLFWPGTYQDYAIAMPFSLLGIDFFAAALVLILYRDTNEDPKANTILTGLITAGTALIIFGFIFVTQNPLQLLGTNSMHPVVAGSYSSPIRVNVPTVSPSTGNFWGFLYTYFSSINSPDISIYSFYVCLVLLGIAGGLATKWSFDQWATPKIGAKDIKPAQTQEAQ